MTNASRATFDAWRRVVESPCGTVLMFVWAFAEATVWPLIADFAMGPMTLVDRRRFPHALAASVAGMATGGIVTYLFAFRSPTRAMHVLERLPIVNADDVGRVEERLRRHGPKAFWLQPYSGIPMKVWAVAAGRLGLSPWKVIPTFIAARALRMTLVTILTRKILGRFVCRMRSAFLPVTALYWITFFSLWRRMLRRQSL
jgi:1-acyl-sn-glycerol-3-phosphate acyltransferase